MPRTEPAIFDELAQLCTAPGYAHAIAHIRLRDGLVGYWGEMTPEDMAGWFSRERLIRTETTTLIGLMVKAPIDFRRPDRDTLEKYVVRSDALLAEMHQAITRAGFKPEDWKQKNTHAARALAVSSVDLI